MRNNDFEQMRIFCVAISCCSVVLSAIVLANIVVEKIHVNATIIIVVSTMICSSFAILDRLTCLPVNAKGELILETNENAIEIENILMENVSILKSKEYAEEERPIEFEIQLIRHKLLYTSLLLLIPLQ